MCVHKGVFPCQTQVNNYSKVLQDEKKPPKNKTIRQQWETQRHKRKKEQIWGSYSSFSCKMTNQILENKDKRYV